MVPVFPDNFRVVPVPEQSSLASEEAVPPTEVGETLIVNSSEVAAEQTPEVTRALKVVFTLRAPVFRFSSVEKLSQEEPFNFCHWIFPV